MMCRTALHLTLCPGEWRLIPWINTLQPSEQGRGFYHSGWRFTWLFIRIERHRLHDHVTEYFDD
jgi:hypothetical protein